MLLLTTFEHVLLYYLQNVYYCKVCLRAHNWVPFDLSSQYSVTLNSNFAIRGGGTDLARKGVWDVRPWRPPFHASPVVRKGPISSKRVSSQDPLLRKVRNFSLYSLNFHPKFSSQAPKFGNFQLTSPQFGIFQFTSPQIWKFSVHKPPPPFQRQMSVRKPHASEIRAAHPYLKKGWVPPPGCYLKNLKLFSIRVKELFEPIVLR